MDAAIGHQRNLVDSALSDRQPVQRVTKYGSDVLVESSASDTLGIRPTKHVTYYHWRR